jgi:AbrB family looped-hinge helix DNA binding protein
MPTAMITFNGRITLPSQVRRKLGLKIGDHVEFVENDKGQFAIAAGSSTASDGNAIAHLELDPSPDAMQVSV